MGRPVINASQMKTIEAGHNDDGSSVAAVMNQMMDPSQRIVYLSGDVHEHTISQVIAQLIYLANVDARAPIQLVVSTYGGSVDEMFSLYDTIKLLPCPVHTVGLGKVMSAGVLLLASGEKGKRMIGKNARIMIHPVSSGFGGNVFQLINEAAEIKRMHNLLVDTLVRETKIKKERLEQIMALGHDKYIVPQEALSMGIVDKIVGE